VWVIEVITGAVLALLFVVSGVTRNRESAQ
jgi:hypothetical protein